MPRPHFTWRLRTRSLELGPRTLVMGIVNVTPDSFSDGGMFRDSQHAVEHALKLLADGADIVDIGGESTRPGAEPITTEEELRRVLPVIEGVLAHAPQAVVSVDTYKAETAAAALDVGAEIVNDVSGFTWDEAMVPLLASREGGCVLMHTRGKPQEWKHLPPLAAEDVVPLVIRDLQRLVERAMTAGVAHERIAVDPGFGFGKRLGENYPLLARLSGLHELGMPIVSGTSRKSFVRHSSGKDGVFGSVTSAVAAVLAGAHVVRVHDVRETVEALRVADCVAVVSQN